MRQAPVLRAMRIAAVGVAAMMLLAMTAHSDNPADKVQAGQEKDKAIIDYRQHIMKTLNEQSAALGQILSTSVPDTNTRAHLEVIALAASIALTAFEPKVQGGEAKPEVWTDWPDFSKRMKEFAQKTAAMAKVAKEQGNEAALANVVDALSCKSCHDVYRAEKVKGK